MSTIQIGDVVATPILIGVVNDVSDQSVQIEDERGNQLVAPRTQVAIVTPATATSCGHTTHGDPCGKGGCVAFNIDANVWW